MVCTGLCAKFCVYNQFHFLAGMDHTGHHMPDMSVFIAQKLNRILNLEYTVRRTHLLQKALREVLGTHVEQAGSYQDSERTRFDFTHFAAMTPEELQKVEEMVNEKINEGMEVRTDIMTVDEAKKTGAMALFGEKYGEKVRVVSMGEFSREFCGGTHVKNTAEIKTFKILSESGVAAGVRRIEALTGDNVIAYYKKMEEELQEAAKVVKSTPANLKERLEHLTTEMKELQSENEALKRFTFPSQSDAITTTPSPILSFSWSPRSRRPFISTPDTLVARSFTPLTSSI